MTIPIAQQIAALDALIAKDAVGKLRRAGDLSTSQADAMRDWLNGARNTLQTVKKHEPAVRECLRRETGNAG